MRVAPRHLRWAVLGIVLGLGAASCSRKPRDNAYDPTPTIGIGETVSVGVRGTEPGGAYSSATHFERLSAETPQPAR